MQPVHDRAPVQRPRCRARCALIAMSRARSSIPTNASRATRTASRMRERRQASRPSRSTTRAIGNEPRSRTCRRGGRRRASTAARRARRRAARVRAVRRSRRWRPGSPGGRPPTRPRTDQRPRRPRRGPWPVLRAARYRSTRLCSCSRRRPSRISRARTVPTPLIASRSRWDARTIDVEIAQLLTTFLTTPAGSRGMCDRIRKPRGVDGVVERIHVARIAEQLDQPLRFEQLPVRQGVQALQRELGTRARRRRRGSRGRPPLGPPAPRRRARSAAS